MTKPRWTAIAPADRSIARYLTPGKEYEVLSFDGETPSYGRGFWIRVHKNLETYCLERKCSHLNNLDWQLVEHPNAS
jgi:hypothetical protein